MSALIPLVIVLLALIAAGSIAYIAWELSSEDFHASFGRNGDADGEGDGDGEP